MQKRNERHLIFFDDECALCGRIVQRIVKADKRKEFLFASLTGKTAAIFFKEPPPLGNGGSLVLVEHYQGSQEKIYTSGKGALRIFWLLGGRWKFFGWLSFLPPILYNWAYRIVAANRGNICRGEIHGMQRKDERFLP